MNKIERLIFIIIIAIAFISRFWQLNKFPVSLNWDEVSHGYNAYSLIKTGQDQWGVKWPIFNFRAYGDYPTTLNMYLSIPFIYFFGLNEFTTRAVSAICGFGLVIVSFYIGKIIFDNRKKYCLLLMFLVSISPWTFFSSRAVFQSTVAQFFLALGIYFLLASLKKPKNILPGLIFSAISTYGYHNTRIVVPLLLFSFVVIFHKKIIANFIKFKKYYLISVLLFSVLFIPQLINMFNKEAQARSRWVFIINPAAINKIEVARNNYQGQPLIAKLKYNKVTYFTGEVFKNYVGFVNPKILFFDSTQNYQFNIPNTGVLFSVLLPFFYIGLIFLVISLFKKRDSQDKGVILFLICWFVFGLVPAVITTGDFPIIRAMTILPLPHIFIIYGLFKTSNIFKRESYKNILLSAVIVITSIQFLRYLQNYFSNYATKYSQSWQYGYKQAVSFIKENYDKYDQIIITKKYGEAHEYVLFYFPYNPQKYLSDPNKITDFHADWYWVDKFDKFTFINDWEVLEKTKDINSNKVLLIASPNQYSKENTKLLEKINFLDGQTAFEILEFHD